MVNTELEVGGTKRLGFEEEDWETGAGCSAEDWEAELPDACSGGSSKCMSSSDCSGVSCCCIFSQVAASICMMSSIVGCCKFDHSLNDLDVEEVSLTLFLFLVVWNSALPPVGSPRLVDDSAPVPCCSGGRGGFGVGSVSGS